MEINFIIGIAVLIMSVVIHELSHGYVANICGDPTAKHQGRLTLNPIRHLSLWGSVIVPFIFILSGTGIVLGWAKPVEINPYNFKNRRWGEFFTALAGPLSNIIMALLFVLILRTLETSLSSKFIEFGIIVIYTNITLAVFNLVPVPPLDGSKLLFTLFPKFFEKIRVYLERYFLVFVMIFVVLFWDIISPIIPKIVLWLLGN
ncbi:MAG: site-2 protease family protein [Candidatus Taylorbacteria bacterium]|nr:site-2 protease family protein [Candidatus Taylorbacteria bacterium]